MSQGIKARNLVVVSAVLILGGCASAKQNVNRLQGDRPKEVCIVQHDAVRLELLEALQDGLRKNGIVSRVVSGSYEQRNQMWFPKWKPADIRGCDALGFYVANWRWDLANYMAFANIWMVTPDGK